MLAPPAVEVEHGDREPEAGRREAIDLTALRALREARRDVEALDLTADRLRRLQGAFTKTADDSRVRADRYTEQDDADAVAPGAPGRPAGAPAAGARTAPRPGGRPLNAPDAAHPMRTTPAPSAVPGEYASAKPEVLVGVLHAVSLHKRGTVVGALGVDGQALAAVPGFDGEVATVLLDESPFLVGGPGLQCGDPS